MKIHMVKKGESLLSLAEKYNVHPDALLSLNSQINSPEQLVPGMRVKIPLPPSPLEVPPAEYLDEYVVRQGDTLWKLSKAWNVPLKALIAVNPQLRNPNVLLDGEIVYIPKLVAEIQRVKIQQQPPAQPSIEPEIPLEPVIEETAYHQKQEPAQEHNDVNVSLYEEVQAEGYEQSHDRIDLSVPHHVEELSYISSLGGASNVDPPQWGDLYTGYMTSAAKSYDKYGIDPRTNIPAYPEVDSLSPDQYQQEKPRPENVAKMANRLSNKASNKASSKAPANPKARAKSGKSRTRNALAELSVQTHQSATKRTSKPTRKKSKSKPWTNL